MSSSIFISRVLGGWIAQGMSLLISLILIASWLALPSQHHLWLILLCPLVIEQAALSTIGWRRVLDQRATPLIQRYFAAQMLSIGVVMAAELASGVTGLAASLLGLPLMLQSAIINGRKRLWILGGLLIFILIFYVPSLASRTFSLEQGLGSLLIFAVVYSLSGMLGSLIVREERAQDTARRLDTANHQLAQRTQEREELAILKERNRLARDIHDSLGHYLTAINMQLEVTAMMLPEDHTSRPALTKAQLMTKEALSEIRRSISGLRANPIENQPLHIAIEHLMTEHRRTGHTVEMQIVGTIRPCSSAVEMALYRIAQEGLTNIRKHAAGSQARVILSYADPDHISLHVRDDGQGAEHRTEGFGLIGMRERVQLLGGTFAIETGAGQGFQFEVVIPT